jgi:hypothetical protein
VAVHSVGCALPKWASALSGNILSEGNFGLTFCPKPGAMAGVADLGADLLQVSYVHVTRMYPIQVEYLTQVGEPRGFAHPQEQIPIFTYTVNSITSDSF